MTTIKPSNGSSGVLRINHVDHVAGDVLMGLEATRPNVIGQVSRYPLAEVLEALDAIPKHVGAWVDQYDAMKVRAEAAEAKLAEAEKAATELAPAEVLVEGSWFKPADLPGVLGNHMRAAAELARKVKAAEAKLEKVRAEAERMESASREARVSGLGKPDDAWTVCNARANVLTEAASAVLSALTDPKPFELPTTPGARFEARYGNNDTRDAFQAIAYRSDHGAATTILYIREANLVALTAKEVMHDFTDHQLIESES